MLLVPHSLRSLLKTWYFVILSCRLIHQDNVFSLDKTRICLYTSLLTQWLHFVVLLKRRKEIYWDFLSLFELQKNMLYINCISGHMFRYCRSSLVTKLASIIANYCPLLTFTFSILKNVSLIHFHFFFKMRKKSYWSCHPVSIYIIYEKTVACQLYFWVASVKSIL